MPGLMGLDWMVEKPYQGIVLVNGQPVPVQNGQAQVQGQVFQVTPKGEAVINQQGQTIGKVENGTFKPAK